MHPHADLLRSCLAALVLASPLPALACATCGCTLSTDAATGYSSQAGWQVNLESVYLDQDQLRHDGSTAHPRQVLEQPVDPSADSAEIERDTRNRYLNLVVAYRPNADWAFSALLPYVSRDHTTFGEQQAPFSSDAVSADQLSGVRVRGPGDARFIVSYQGFLPTHNLGVQLGVKLPTGRHGGQNEDSGAIAGDPVRFSSGPMSGEPLDASLQAGTGSTDLIVGAYYYQPVSQNFDLAVSGQYQAAFAQRLDRSGADFRPGNQATASIGLRYEKHARWVPQIQLNLLRKSADHGALADRANTAGTVAYLSPGISATIAPRLQVYAFAQVPVYSRLDGYQLFPRWTATLGLSMAF